MVAESRDFMAKSNRELKETVTRLTLQLQRKNEEIQKLQEELNEKRT